MPKSDEFPNAEPPASSPGDPGAGQRPDPNDSTPVDPTRTERFPGREENQPGRRDRLPGYEEKLTLMEIHGAGD